MILYEIENSTFNCQLKQSSDPRSGDRDRASRSHETMHDSERGRQRLARDKFDFGADKQSRAELVPTTNTPISEVILDATPFVILFELSCLYVCMQADRHACMPLSAEFVSAVCSESLARRAAR